MAEPSAPTAEPSKASVDTELLRLREENLRLRDQLIARDTEAGLLRGQVAELEAGAARAAHLLQRIKALAPGIVWRVFSHATGLLRRG